MQEMKEHVELRDAASAGYHQPQSVQVPSPVALLKAPSQQGKREGGFSGSAGCDPSLPHQPHLTWKGRVGSSTE